MTNNNCKFLTILFTLSLTLLVPATTLPAMEYTHTYRFERPEVKEISEGKQIVDLEGVRQDDSVIGAPLLPVKTARILISADEKVTSVSIDPRLAELIEGTYSLQHATRPHPMSSRNPAAVDEPDPVIYQADQFYPRTTYRPRGAQYLHGAQIVLVDIMPVLYNPVTGQIEYFKEIEVKIQTEKAQRLRGVRPFRNLSPDRKRILDSVDNHDDFLSLHPTPLDAGGDQIQPVGGRDYVVITTSAMETAFRALTAHRESAVGGGFTTHIETMENIRSMYPGVDDAEQIRNFIIDMYDNFGTQFVVLGGDCDGPHGTQLISTRGCYSWVESATGLEEDNYIPTDLYFGCLDGSWNNDGDGLWGESNDGTGGGDIDWSSEVYIGRIPADDASEVTLHINKIIAYETGGQLFKTLLVGEKLADYPTWGGDRLDWVYGYMSSVPKTQLYDRDYAPLGWQISTLLTYINSNAYNWLNHLGHGNNSRNMKLYNSDLSSMTNTTYFFHYSQACYSGSIDGRSTSDDHYDSDDCVLEDFVNWNSHGAFAVIGNSRYGWYSSSSVTTSSNLAHKEFVEAIFTDGDTRLGTANQKSKTQLDLTNGVYRWIAFETNLLGCPATEMTPCTISPRSGSFVDTGGAQTVEVNAAFPTYTWTATENLDWISLSSSGGTGSGSVTITAASNTGAARGGTVFIAGRSFPVFQSPAGTLAAIVSIIQNVILDSSGSLQVTIEPAEATQLGAQWQVDGGAWHASGERVNLSAGNHGLGFKPIDGWNTPPAQTVAIEDGKATLATGSYTPQASGSITVIINPPEAAQAGLLWRIDGGDWHTSGYTLSGLSAGQHILEYQCIPGWVCPQSETLTIEDGQVLNLTRIFVRKRALPWLHLLLGYLTPSLQTGLTTEPATEGARSGEESPCLVSSLGSIDSQRVYSRTDIE